LILALHSDTPSGYIATEAAGFTIPADRKFIVVEGDGIGKQYPYSMEKLAPVLGFYTVKDWLEACELSIKILHHEGAGHTLAIHSQNEEIIREFALKKPVSRLLINTPAALGGVGATTGLFPAFTLGCGAVGGSATSDNVSPLNLFNIRRVAYGTSELSDLRQAENMAVEEPKAVAVDGSNEEELVTLLVQRVLEKLK